MSRQMPQNNYQQGNNYNNQQGMRNDMFQAPTQNSSNSNNNINMNVNVNSGHEAEVKKILTQEIIDKIFSNIVKEMKRLKSEEDRIKIYAEHFKKSANKYLNVFQKQEHVSSMDTGQIDREIAEINASIAELQDKKITNENCLDYVSDPNEVDRVLMKLISIEATLEDLLSVYKKGFERKAIDFGETVRSIRYLSRELLKVKFYREQYIIKMYKG